MVCAVRLSSCGDPVNVLKIVHLPEPEPSGLGAALLGAESVPASNNDLLIRENLPSAAAAGTSPRGLR